MHILPPAHPLGGAKDWFGLVCSIVFNDNLNIISVISCRVHLAITTLVVIVTDYIGSRKSHYHTIMTTTDPQQIGNQII